MYLGQGQWKTLRPGGLAKGSVQEQGVLITPKQGQQAASVKCNTLQSLQVQGKHVAMQKH